MKEAKEKPLAKLTASQLQDVKSNLSQIHSLGKSLDRAYSMKERIQGQIREAYLLSTMDFHINLKTGEIYESWPEVK